MTSVISYIRSLLGWSSDDPTYRTSSKRERECDEFLSDEDPPAIKRLRQLHKSTFPDIMRSEDTWKTESKPNTKVRYIPIEVETDLPSTSTPKDGFTKYNKVRKVPIKLDNLSGISPSTSTHKSRQAAPVRPVIHELYEEDDDEIIIERQPPKKPPLLSKHPTKIYVNLDDEEEDEDHSQQDDDIIFVKKVTPHQVKPVKCFLTNTDNVDGANEVQYYRLAKKINDKTSSPKASNRFVAPAGITKSYKKSPVPLPKWMQTQKSKNSFLTKSRLLNLNGNTRSTLSEVFNLDEKRNYRELIKSVIGKSKPALNKPSDIVNLAEESAAFWHTQRSQKHALHELSFVEKSLIAEKENVESDKGKEYDPITVASINSSDSEVEIVPSECSTSSSTRIDPINTLKDSYKDKAVTDSDFLSKVGLKYRMRNLQIQEKLREARRESDIISKINNEQKLAHLQHKLKYELSIPECLIEEPEPAVELPPLTPEQEKLVSRALGPGPANQVLVEKFNLKIHRRDIQTLAGLNWLNDEVINFYMNLIMQRSEERKDLPKVYAANTFFYPKLMQSGQSGLRRWTRKVDIFAHDLMVVPVHLGVHWCVSLVDFRQKTIQYLDSMGSNNQACLAALLQYLKDEHKDKKGQPFDDSGWKTECISKKIPQQMNGSDCGVFSCTFAEFAARDAPFSFTQAHMPYLRRKAVLELLQGRLLL